MAFCSKCGYEAEDGALFCGKCGSKMVAPTKIEETDSTPKEDIEKPKNSQRKMVYEGEIHKCPSCGCVLSSFVKNCPECGFEIRGAASSNSVTEFSEIYAGTKSNAKRVDLIRTFVIPNTKEDILEFVVLASSNVDAKSYSRKEERVSNGVSEHDVIEAWMAKFEQAQQKANLLLADDPCLQKINSLYTEKKKELSSARKALQRKKTLNRVRGFGIALGCVALYGLLMLYLELDSTESKLERQVKKVEKYIAEENYESALTTATAMSTNYSDSWTQTRASLIERINKLQGNEPVVSENNEGKVQFPTESLHGKQVNDVVTALSSAGFTDITQEPAKKDPLIGWLDNLTTTKGSVQEITINGSDDYYGGEWFDSDVKIIVRYWD